MNDCETWLGIVGPAGYPLALLDDPGPGDDDDDEDEGAGGGTGGNIDPDDDEGYDDEDEEDDDEEPLRCADQAPRIGPLAAPQQSVV